MQISTRHTYVPDQCATYMYVDPMFKISTRHTYVQDQYAPHMFRFSIRHMYVQDQYATDAVAGRELMHQLGFPSFNAVGWSAGGTTALIMASRSI